MIGIVLLLVAAAGALVSLLTGWGGLALARRAIAAGSHGWPLFWTITALAILLILAALVAWLVFAPRATPPQAADFTRLFQAGFLFGAAPGFAMLLAGAVVSLR